MTQEEKAKAYDEAIEKAKAWCDCEHATTDDKILLKRIFPELKESEDEKIRRAIIDVFKSHHDYEVYYGVSVTDILAWLEKQGEQKDICDTCEHPMLNCQNFPCDRRQGEQKSADKVESSTFRNKLLELFQRFRWYCKDKTLTNGDIIDYVDAHIQKLIDTVQNKPWSEEDENRVNRLIAYFEDKESFTAEDDIVYANWLKSLKDRVQLQSKQEWSEEDKAILEKCVGAVKSSCYSHSFKLEAENWLKSLRPQKQ